MIESISYSLLKANETSLYQFKKILYIGEIVSDSHSELIKLFKNADIFNFNTDVAILNSFPVKFICFDLIIINKINLTQLENIISRFKFRYISVIGSQINSDALSSNTDRIDIEHDIYIYKSKIKYYDLFMPIGPSDYIIAESSLANKYQKLPDIREIFYCASEDLNLNATYISENSFPFCLAQVQLKLGHDSERAGWYYAQLKEMYIHKAVPWILDDHLSVNADVFFNKTVNFFDGTKTIFTYGHENPHSPYFYHMKQLLPQLQCFDGRSAISMHAMFNRQLLQNLFWDVEKNTGEEFWVSFLTKIHPDHKLLSGAAEYEIYFNYLRMKNIQVITREPNYFNTGNFQTGIDSPLDYFAYHWYIRSDINI
jgi:hypothetical protein